MEAGCNPEGSLYAQLDRFEQSLDSELDELQGFLNQAHESSNDHGQDENDVLDNDTVNDTSCKSNLFFKTEACCNETCIVKSTSRRECNGEIAYREAFYRGGNHSFHGEVALDLQHAFDTNFEDIPVILSMIQQQQHEFAPLPCDSEHDSPETNSFIGPLHELETAQNFLISEVSSEGLSGDIEKLDPTWQIYYELVGDTSNLFRDIIFACSRIYSKGKSFISLYFEGVLYTAVQHDDCGLLDLDFLAYFTGKEGATIAMYNDTTWMKLSAWKRAKKSDTKLSLPNVFMPKFESIHDHTIHDPAKLEDLVSDGYVQSYYILKPKEKNCKEREVIFRFGSWFYSGKVDLPAIKSLQDIPNVIREMRLAQHKLEFVGDVSSLPASNKFVKPMQCLTLMSKHMEEEAVSCEDYLHEIMTQADVGREGNHWLEDDDTTCFFEFACDNDVSSPTTETLEAVELVCSKVYNASGVITISIYHQGTFYLQLEEMSGEFPLLDSKFPDLSKKRGGRHIKTYPRGREGWPGLRSVSIWQSALSTDVQSVPAGVVDPSPNGTNMSKVARKQRRQSMRSLLPVRRKNRLL